VKCNIVEKSEIQTKALLICKKTDSKEESHRHHFLMERTSRCIWWIPLCKVKKNPTLAYWR